MCKLTFKKNDEGKPRPDLITPQLLQDMGEILATGADLYGELNWQECTDVRRFEAALFRHLLAYLSGQKIDPDSGRSHLAHIAVNSSFLYWFDNQ